MGKTVAIPIKIKNKKFPSINSASKYYNIDNSVVRNRLNKGWTINEAFGLNKRECNAVCKGKVYIITNVVNKKVYIGVTTSKINERFNHHKHSASKGSTTKFHIALKDIGPNKFKIKLLQEANNRNDLRSLEIKYICKYDSIVKGYNTSKGGNNCLGDKIGRVVYYKNKKFNSIKALADFLDIPKNILRIRLDNNQKLDVPVKNHVRKPRIIKYKGVTYNSITSLAKHLNLKWHVVKHRFDNNLPLDAPVGSLNTGRAGGRR